MVVVEIFFLKKGEDTMMNAVRSVIGGGTIEDHERKPSQQEKLYYYLAAGSSLRDTSPT